MSTHSGYNPTTKILRIRFDDMRGVFVIHIDENGLRSGKKGEEVCEWQAYTIHVVYERNLLRRFTEEQVKAEGLRLQFPIVREEYRIFQPWLAEKDLFGFRGQLEEAINDFLKPENSRKTN